MRRAQPGRPRPHRPRPWLGLLSAGRVSHVAVNPTYTDTNADVERADLASVYHDYRELIALPHRGPAIVDGDFTMLLADHEQVDTFGRRRGATGLHVLANFPSQPTTLELPEPSRWLGSVLVPSNLPDPQPLTDVLTLRPWKPACIGGPDRYPSPDIVSAVRHARIEEASCATCS